MAADKAKKQKNIKNTHYSIEFNDSVKLIDYEIKSSQEKLEKRRNELNRLLIVTAIATLVITITSLVTFIFFTKDSNFFVSNIKLITSTFIFPLVAFIGILGGVVILFFPSRSSDVAELSARKLAISQFNEDGDEKKKEKKQSSYDKLVEINIGNLAAYYELVKKQTDNSYKTSRNISIVGFILILTGLIVSYFLPKNVEGIAYLISASGVITEFISAIFFWLYSQTVRQLKGYHESLLRVQNILLSFKIIEDIKDDTIKGNTISQMVQYLVGNNEKFKNN